MLHALWTATPMSVRGCGCWHVRRLSVDTKLTTDSYYSVESQGHILGVSSGPSQESLGLTIPYYYTLKVQTPSWPNGRLRVGHPQDLVF
jgi:hypothetical protein